GIRDATVTGIQTCALPISSLGMMRAQMASISLASSAVKNSNLGGAADCAAWCAWVAAARRPGQCAETQTAESPPAPWAKKRRRLRDGSISASLKCIFGTVRRGIHSVKDLLAHQVDS